MISNSGLRCKLYVAFALLEWQISQLLYYGIKHRLDCSLVFGIGGSLEVEIDVELLSFISEVLHLDSAGVVEITLVSNEDLNRICGAGPLHSFVVVRDTFERRGQVDGVDNYDCVSSVEEILSNRKRSGVASRVPNIQLDLFWLPVLNNTWHVHNFVLVLDADSRLVFAKSKRVRHKLVDDRGLPDTRITNQDDFSFWNVVGVVYVLFNTFVL